MMVRFKILRFNPEKDRKPKYQRFDLEVPRGMTLLKALRAIKADMDGSLTFRWSCASSICGSCAITVNGKNVLACKTQVDSVMKKTIVIEPLAGFPIIKDLVVDWEPLFRSVEAIQPYPINDEEPPEKERLQDQATRHTYDDVAQCILCGSCTSSCPVGWTDRRYLGPAALAKAWRFVTDDRDRATAQRLDMVNNEFGVWRCRTIFRCVDACPKYIDTTGAIERLRKAIVRYELKGEV